MKYCNVLRKEEIHNVKNFLLKERDETVIKKSLYISKFSWSHQTPPSQQHEQATTAYPKHLYIPT